MNDDQIEALLFAFTWIAALILATTVIVALH